MEKHYGLKLLMVSYQPVKSGGHTHCESEDVMILVCQDHVIKEPCDYMGRSPSNKVTILSCLVAIGTVIAKI